jgi:hypothetical protein
MGRIKIKKSEEITQKCGMRPINTRRPKKACVSFGLTHSNIHPCDVRYTRYTVTPVHLQRLMTI